MSSFDHVPDELLDHIFSYLDGPAPSESKLYNQPFYGLTASTSQPLKYASHVSKRWRNVVLPRILRCVRLRLGCDGHMDMHDRQAEIRRFGSFIEHEISINSNLARPSSLVIEFLGIEDGDTDSCASRISGDSPKIWAEILRPLAPSRVTILAPPRVLSDLTDCGIYLDYRYSYHMPVRDSPSCSG